MIWDRDLTSTKYVSYFRLQSVFDKRLQVFPEEPLQVHFKTLRLWPAVLVEHPYERYKQEGDTTDEDSEESDHMCGEECFADGDGSSERAPVRGHNKRPAQD